MARAGRLGCLIALPLLAGCGYASARANDFADIWRINVETGALGIEADVKVGELAHVGVGMKGFSRYGTTYGIEQESKDWAEIHLPLSLIYAFGREPFALHYVRALGDTRSPYVWWWGPYQSAEDRCFALLPPVTERGSSRRTLLHSFDLEVSAFVLIFGLEFGISLGELVDFVLGIFTIDIAGDDTREGRAKRRLYEPPSMPAKP
ncbi:MAG: hypothetical protein HYY17_04385 [Planctomycetes bacterium]|nr:hypothetical protein [Planctomycetota bacterium]